MMDLKQPIDVLKKGGIILYPTDTVWGLGCDARNTTAIQRIVEIKGKKEITGFIVLVSDINMLGRYIKNIPDPVFDLQEHSHKPITFVLEGPTGVAPMLVYNNSLALRIPKNEYCLQLIKKFGGAIVSTSANLSVGATPSSFKEIVPEIKNQVDFIAEQKYEAGATGQASTIIKIAESGEFVFIRK